MAKLYRDLEGIDERERGIALGVFDGVHQGHLELLRRLREACQAQGLVPSVFTFSYEAGFWFNHRTVGHDFLMTEEEKIEVLSSEGLEDIFIIPLTDDFCRLSAFEFLDRVISSQVGGRILAIGEDGRFGFRGRGDAGFLLDYAASHPLTPLIVDPVSWRGGKVSSSRIREALAQGRPEEAQTMMTRPFSLWGTVISGNKLGSRLGFPTANIDYPPRSVLIRRGVYKTLVTWKGVRYPAVTSVGVAPTVRRESRRLLVETYLYDFEGDLYGQEIRVEFLAFVRQEENFSTLAELKARVDEDLAVVRGLHAL